MSVWNGDPHDFPPGELIAVGPAPSAQTPALDAPDPDASFAFDLRDDLAADDAPVGYAGGVVTILLDPDALTGIALSPDAARRLATTLIDCAHLAEIEGAAPC